MKRVLLVIALLGAGAASARAGVLELNAQIHTGGQAGSGIYGEDAVRDAAFHEGATGFTYGFIVGAEFLFIDGWIQHDQYHDGNRVDGTWTAFMVGFDLQFDLGDGKLKKDGTREQPKGFGEFGLGLGFGVGTGQQVDPPLDNSEVTDKGVLAEAHLAFGYRLNKVMAIGLHLPMQMSYLIKNDVANDLDNHYASLQGSALLTLRMNFSLK